MVSSWSTILAFDRDVREHADATSVEPFDRLTGTVHQAIRNGDMPSAERALKEMEGILHRELLRNPGYLIYLFKFRFTVFLWGKPLIHFNGQIGHKTVILTDFHLDRTCRTYNRASSGCELTPLGQGGGSGFSENVAEGEMAQRRYRSAATNR